MGFRQDIQDSTFDSNVAGIARFRGAGEPRLLGRGGHATVVACGRLKLGPWFADGFDAMCHVPGQLRDPRGGLAPSRQPEGLPETALFNTALGEVFFFFFC